MQFKAAFIATAFLASASLAMTATINVFAGADCTGTKLATATASSGVCLTLGHESAKSISYSGVPHEIQFFVSGGPHDNCKNGPSLVLGAGSGCGTAPAGFNWESVLIE